MKKIFIVIIAFTFSLSGSAQTYTNNFESGNWLYYFNLCWGIGSNNSYFGTIVNSNANQGFNGTFACESANLGQANICRIESPWIEMIPGSIVFDHAIRAFDGTRKLKVFAIQHGTNSETQIGSTITYSNSVPLSTSFPVSLTGIYKIRWQWEGSGGNSRGQLDNIRIPGIDISDPSRGCIPYVPPPPDADGDGVPNDADEYPNDRTRAYNNFYPASGTNTLAFEDLWPSYGDYDLNDMVIGYKFKIVSNSQNQVVEIFNTLILRANGAGGSNGFGYQLPGVNPGSIVTVTGTGDQIGYSVGANGTEIGNTGNATIIAFANAHKIMPYWNTVKNDSPGPSVEFNIKISFMNNGVPGPSGTVTVNSLNIAAWNPFIVINANRGKEVHLPDYPPTDLADYSVFGSEDDDTRPGSGKRYKSRSNLPWALDIQGTFDYPAEHEGINAAYLHFRKWVESSGTKFTDWWSNTSSDYRNNTKIY